MFPVTQIRPLPQHLCSRFPPGTLTAASLRLSGRLFPVYSTINTDSMCYVQSPRRVSLIAHAFAKFV